MNRDTSNLVSGRGYGFFIWADLFTRRQLVALTTFSDLMSEARERVQLEATDAGRSDAGLYADAIIRILHSFKTKCHANFLLFLRGVAILLTNWW